MHSFQLVVLTPPGAPEPSLAIAASRAAGLGVLNLEFAPSAAEAEDALGQMARFGRRPMGLRLDSAAPDLASAMLPRLPEVVATVILTAGDVDALPGLVRAARAGGRSVWLEVTNESQARLGEELAVDGVIAKGNEADGWVEEESTFILLQRLLSRVRLPVWAWGGIGLHSAAACAVAGAAGVVLDSQLALTRESRLPGEVKSAIASMDGSETMCLGSEVERLFRAYTRPRLPVIQELQKIAAALAQEGGPRPDVERRWRGAVSGRVGWGPAPDCLWPLGQDVAFASHLAGRYHTVGGVLEAFRQAVAAHLREARRLRPLDAASPLAQSHGTRYPIVQGPMTRVSDRAEFALEVAEGGGLPFLALALMRGSEAGALLEETKRLLGDRPWGVGVLGFVPLTLRQEQMEVIRRVKPPFALIAGGRPDQARSLEQEGIATYLHVPSPNLLRLFLKDGARRFVFEGRECGGHVGPRSSFVLWNTMVDVLLEEVPAAEASSYHVLFAGGIHDARSASVVAGLAAPLAERGVRVGVLLGTAYLFTREAVASGAIVPRFQEEALRCRHTVLVESGPGHAIRCVQNPYTEEFERAKQSLFWEQKSAEEVRQALEELNIGRLRLASKGVKRNPLHGQDPQAPRLVDVDAEEQRAQGMYMIGQLAALRDGVTTIADLHHEIAIEGSRRLEAMARAEPVETGATQAPRPSQIAIIGISCILPKAPNLRAYWDNILAKVYAITEVPKERWDWELYFDADPKAKDKIYSKWGGFIDEVPFDPLEFGIPPTALPSIDPMHLLALKAAREALEDAGYLGRAFDRARTSVILGASGGSGDLGTAYNLRSGLPLLFGKDAAELLERADGALPEWTEDSFAGLLLNVAAGRITNRFDLGGVNFTVDAACASSLAAVYLAVKELETHNTDLALVGGVDTVQSPFGYLCFSKTHALSPTGQPRTFDASADGIAISEGVVMLVLKRLADAERDGDRIYALIQGVSGSSDGKAKGLTAPRPEGQMLALERAYPRAGISPTSVGLFEAHGTGTVVGDRTEVLSLSAFLEKAGAAPMSHAIGSVKSMIGHTKATAGVAGLAKVALALHHKVLPATLGVTKPNPKARFGEGPLYVNSETRPWLHDSSSHPRRAGVSAFGFGGTNFHAVLEEYTGGFLPAHAISPRWPSELLLWAGASRQELLAALAPLDQALRQGAEPPLHDLACTLSESFAAQGTGAGARLAIVATSQEHLRQQLALAQAALAADGPVQDPRGIYHSDALPADAGAVAFLFPGQGSQYPNMLCDLALHFPEVREAFERADRQLSGRFPRSLSGYIFPPPAFSPEEEQGQQQALTETHVAQPALGAAGTALFHLLRRLGVKPRMVAGHSYGEYVALHAAGVFDEETLTHLSEARGRCIREAAGQDLGTMAAVSAGPERVAEVVGTLPDVWVANLNAPTQTIISGTRAGLEQAVGRLQTAGVQARSIPVSCAFHSPLVAPAQDRLATFLSAARLSAPGLPVYSNTTAGVYPRDPRAVGALLAEHLTRPVRFAEEIEAMYAAGARVFVEVGPRNVLTSLVKQILGRRPHLALATDQPGKPGLTQLQHMLGQLAVQGLALDLGPFFQGRPVQRLSLAALLEKSKQRPLSPTTWLVSGSRVRPHHQLMEPPRRPPLESVARQLAAPNDVAEAPSAPAAPKDASHAASPPAPEAAASVPDAHMLPRNGDPTGQVVLDFHRVMSRIVEAQRNVMLTYLQGTTAAPPQSPQGTGSPASRLAPVTQGQRAQRAVSPKASPPVTKEAPAPAPAAATNGAAKTPIPESEPAAAAPPARTRPVREEMTQQLLKIVSERTGYPPEMLDLGADLEAQLGIDSIKRVEILGVLQQQYLPEGRQADQDAMEQLTGIKTLQGIVSWLEKAVRGVDKGQGSEPVPAPLSPEPLKAGTTPAPSESTTMVRSRLVAVDAALPDGEPPFYASDRVFLITDDGRGVADAVAGQLRALGGRAALIRLGREVGEVESGVFQADLTSPAQVAELLTLLRRRVGTIGALLHLLPLRDGSEGGDGAFPSIEHMDLAGWRQRLRREVKSLFYLARAASGDLKQAADDGRAWVLTAAPMGGAWATEGSPGSSSPFFPGHAGLAGLVKTLSLEWPAVRCKAVDLDPRQEAALLATQVVRELSAEDRRVQVGYRDGRRQVLEVRPALLPEGRSESLRLDPGSVVLVTGGARGITAEVALDLARTYRPTLVIAGRTPPPDEGESPRTAGLTSPQQLKAALIEQMRQAGEEVVLARVESAYHRLLKAREVRSSLERMRQAGATVRYEPVDVCDEQGVARLMQRIEREYGRLDGVIHGAGVIEDKLIEDKSPESFDRVFDTKADSAFLLSRAIKPNALKFFVLFSSVAGAFGNRGQGDYAAANEVLNSLAAYLDGRWPGRVVAAGWGPWKKGMVSAELEQQFAARGVQLIDVAAGCRALDRELRSGQKGEAAVVLTAGASARRLSEPAAAGSPYPLLQHGTRWERGGGVITAFRTLDPAYDRYLLDHQLDGKPVLPLAVAAELLAEVVQAEWPDLHITAVRDLQLLKGVVLTDGPVTIRLAARAQTSPPNDRAGADVNVEITDPNRHDRVYYRGVVELTDRLPEPALWEPPPADDLDAFPMTVEEAYREWLFHGPLFQGIAAIEGLTQGRIAGTLTPSTPQDLLTGGRREQWLIDPVVLDCAIQMVCLWSRATQDVTPLPARFRRYARFAPLRAPVIGCYAAVSPTAGSPLVRSSIYLVGQDRRLLAVVEDLETTGSKALNRLAVRAARV
jgi:acyl transferase domain-containing protein/NAD(P)H-dependent flavin oxidoreductase YrpB (nitropropane dioxygenase family)/NAD(P)-dependent dehydrogenase (short-subunit alcohol dehydrogenase family)